MTENYELNAWDFVPLQGLECYKERKSRDLRAKRGNPRVSNDELDRTRTAYKMRVDALTAYNGTLVAMGLFAVGVVVYSILK